MSSADLFQDKKRKKISLNFLNKSKRDTLSEWMNENVRIRTNFFFCKLSRDDAKR